jgi:CRP/FNR family cyclic AMP-dependent transcriptional regulator
MLTVIDKVMFLRGIPIFSSTTTENLARVASIAQEVEFKKGAQIFQTGDPGDAMYFIIKGAVRLHRDHIDVFIVSDNESFGELEILANEPRFVAATALEDVSALKISNEEFYELLADNIKIAQDIFKILVSRIKVLMENSKMSLVFWLKDD